MDSRCACLVLGMSRNARQSLTYLTPKFQVIFLIKDYLNPGQTLGNAVVHAVPFWLTLIMTCSIILPWLRLRKVPVRAEVLSDHCVRLHFDYGEHIHFHFPIVSAH